MGWIHLQKRFRLRTDPGNGPICEAAYMGGEKAQCEFTGKSGPSVVLGSEEMHDDDV